MSEGVSAPASAPPIVRPKRVLSARELESRRANLAKARAVGKEILYRPTERRQAASRANLQKAIAARRAPEGNANARLNALRHGLFAHRLEDSVKMLGENPEDLARHRLLFLHTFVPEDEQEGEIVARLADLVWRRLRLFRAQADWEMRRLHALFGAAEGTESLGAYHTERRAYALMRALVDWDDLLRESGKIISGIERQLRKLIYLRSGGTRRFRVFSPRREAKESDTDRFIDWMGNLFIASQTLRQIKNGEL